MTLFSADPFHLLLPAVVSVLLVICQKSQAQATCPPECPDVCFDETECCSPGFYWRVDDQDSENDTYSTATPFPVTSSESVTSASQCYPCSDVIDYCEACSWNASSGDIVCGRCSDGLQPSPQGDACEPVDSALPVWLIPVIVVVVVMTTVVMVAVIFVILRWRRSTHLPRPPLPRPDELDDPPADHGSKKRRWSMKRDRYTCTPKNSKQDALPTHGSSSSSHSEMCSNPRRRVAEASTVSEVASKPGISVSEPKTKKATKPVGAAAAAAKRKNRTQPDQELYVNYSTQEDGEVYANDMIQPAVTNGETATGTRLTDNNDQGEMEEEYENVSRTDNTTEQLNEDDGRHIYQNVSGKPTAAPKPARRFH